MTLRPPRRAGPAVLRHDQERPVREGHPARAAAARGGQELPELAKLIPAEKLPDFSVFAKYLTLGGSYSTHG